MARADVAAGPTYHIRVFRTARCRVKGRYAYAHYARDRDHAYAIYIAVVQGNGLTALVDTGMVSVEEMNRGAGFLMTEPVSQEPGEDTHSILARVGVEPSNVDLVFLTHCHYDHCSLAPLFADARIVIPERAWRIWHEEPERTAYLHAGFLEYLESRRAAGRLVLRDDGLVAPGLGVRWVGGHSPCSQFVYVNTTKGVAVLTGDAVQMYANLEQNDVIHICERPAERWQALEIARSDADYVIPGHDPRVLECYPDGVIA